MFGANETLHLILIDNRKRYLEQNALHYQFQRVQLLDVVDFLNLFIELKKKPLKGKLIWKKPNKV